MQPIELNTVIVELAGLYDNPDIKRSVAFLVGLLDNNYFLPNKDPKIKAFFESHYQINIGQNFENSRRRKYIDTNNIIFNEYEYRS